jgi:ethanolamine permease
MAIIAVGYLCLVLCLAEMCSLLTFGGGSYGYVRCALHPFIGYLVGCAAAVEYIVYVAAAVLTFGVLMNEVCQTPSSYSPLWWALFYIVGSAIHLRGGLFMYWSSNILTIITTLLIVIYCFESLEYVNATKYIYRSPVEEAETNIVNGFSGDGNQFMYYLPLFCWLFVGIEAMPTSVGDTIDVS